MDTAAPASEAGLPEVADGGQHRRAPRVTGQRAGLVVLLAGVAAATVAVPPLITPHHRSPSSAPPGVPARVAPAASPAPLSSLAPPTSLASPSAVCAPATGALTAQPSCRIYAGGLGNGWTASGDGLKVLPGAVVPDTKEPAMRVERSRPPIPATTMTITARTAVGLAPGAKLTFRVWGGREFGTVALVSAGPDSGAPVRISAPADRWTSYTIPLGRGRLQRITLAVEADQVPNVNRFFLDDIAIS